MSSMTAMKRILVAIVIAMGSAISHASLVDVNTFTRRTCEMYSERYADAARHFGGLYQEVVDATQPDSPDRHNLLKIIDGNWRKYEDTEFIAGKELEKSLRQNGWSTHQLSLMAAIRSTTLSIARSLSINERGNSVTYYWRRIEQECISVRK
jgi:hypothetical protein